MYNDFWRAKSLPERRSTRNSDSSPFRTIIDPGSQILQQFLFDVEDGRVPGAEVKMNAEASAELERRILHAYCDSSFRTSVVRAVYRDLWIEPQFCNWAGWRPAYSEPVDKELDYEDEDDEDDEDIPF